MINIYRLLSLIILLSGTKPVSSQTTLEKKVRIVVKFLDKPPVQPLEVFLWKETNCSPYMPVPTLVHGNKNRYVIQLDHVTDIGRLDVQVHQTYEAVLRNQVFEPGDDIVILVKTGKDGKRDFSVSGNGSAKYRYLYKSGAFSGSWPQLRRINRLGDTLLGRKAIIDSIYAEQEILIKSYAGISSKVRKLLLTDVKGDLYRTGVFLNMPHFRPQYSTDIEELANFDQEDSVDNEIVLFSNAYIRYLYQKMKLRLLLKFGWNPVTKKPAFQFYDLYDALSRAYSGLLRERLLTLSALDNYEFLGFFDGADPHLYDSCLQNAAQLIKTPHLKKAVEDKISKFAVGSQVFNATFHDTSGRKILMKDFRGKVVFIDIWGAGCGPCRAFHRLFAKEIYPKIKNDSTFVFLSLNIDAVKSRWLEELQAYYAVPSYINAGVPGEGAANAFFTYYGISTMPFLMLVDQEGKLISASFSMTNSDDLLLAIQRALNGLKVSG